MGVYTTVTAILQRRAVCSMALALFARPASEARTLDIPSLPMWSEVPGRKDAAMGLRAHLMWTVTNAIKDWTMCG